MPLPRLGEKQTGGRSSGPDSRVTQASVSPEGSEPLKSAFFPLLGRHKGMNDSTQIPLHANCTGDTHPTHHPP